MTVPVRRWWKPRRLSLPLPAWETAHHFRSSEAHHCRSSEAHKRAAPPQRSAEPTKGVRQTGRHKRATAPQRPVEPSKGARRRSRPRRVSQSAWEMQLSRTPVPAPAAPCSVHWSTCWPLQCALGLAAAWRPTLSWHCLRPTLQCCCVRGGSLECTGSTVGSGRRSP